MPVRENPSESARTGLIRPSFEGMDESLKSRWVPPVTIFQDDKGYLIEVELPGINREDVAVASMEGVITISGERKKEERDKAGKCLYVERRYGLFLRKFALPEDAAFDRVTAELRDGILKVRVPKSEKVLPKFVGLTPEGNVIAPDSFAEGGVFSGGGDWLTKLKDDERARAAITEALEATAQGVTKAFAEETAPSESAVLLSVINKWGDVAEEKIAQKFATDNAFEMAHLRGDTAKIELLEKAGPMLTAGEAAEALNVSRQAVHKRIQSGSLFGMMYKGESRIPAWQIREGEVVPGIAKVLKNLETTDWGKMLFLHSENMQLAGRKPMDLILEGDADSVAEVAALFGEQGAK